MSFDSPLLWILLFVSLLSMGFMAWFFFLATPLITKVFLDLPIKAEPFRNEEGILRYSVNLKSRDGVSIKGFFLPGKNPNGRTVVFCHEIGAGAASSQKYATFLREKGFNIFTFDFRGHGLSGNLLDYEPRQWVTQHEVSDLKAVLKFLKNFREIDPKRIGLFGISKGAATALIVASKKKWVRAIVSDGAFSTGYTLVDYIRKWTSVYLPIEALPKVLCEFVRAWTLWVVSKKIKTRLPAVEKAISRLRHIPLFMIHGERDNYICVDQARRLFALAKEPCQLWVVPKARHNEAVRVCPEEYENKVSAFFEKYL